MKDWLDIWSVTIVSLIILALIMFLTGCVTVQVAATLPFPPAPALHFTACQPGYVCLTDADGNSLRKFFDQLDAFAHAQNRIAAPTP